MLTIDESRKHTEYVVICKSNDTIKDCWEEKPTKQTNKQDCWSLVINSLEKAPIVKICPPNGKI